MARVRCIMMQRDETQLLEPWLRHHGYLFGFENLTVIDNGSRDPDVLRTLRRYEAAGVVVERGHDTPADFLAKGEHVARHVRAFDEAADYDFALPLDCDEFLSLFEGGRLVCGRAAIHAALDALRGERRALGIEMSLSNAPGWPGWFIADRMEKGFLPAGCVLDIDHGFHQPRSRIADGVCWTRLCFLHFHNKPFSVLLAHARRKLDGLVDHRDPAALHAYRGINFHLVPYFFMTEAQYRQIPERLLTLSVPSFAVLAGALGITDPLFLAGENAPALSVRPPGGRSSAFDGAAYLRRNPDVAAAGMDPLHHYLRHGWLEGRAAG